MCSLVLSADELDYKNTQPRRKQYVYLQRCGKLRSCALWYCLRSASILSEAQMSAQLRRNESDFAAERQIIRSHPKVVLYLWLSKGTIGQ
jgi:hypothetical protein